MFHGSWSLYDTPRHPRKWMFHPRKRSWLLPQVLGLTLLGMMVLTIFSGA